jgi:hypothetical protein
MFLLSKQINLPIKIHLKINLNFIKNLQIIKIRIYLIKIILFLVTPLKPHPLKIQAPLINHFFLMTPIKLNYFKPPFNSNILFLDTSIKNISKAQALDKLLDLYSTTSLKMKYSLII